MQDKAKAHIYTWAHCTQWIQMNTHKHHGSVHRIYTHWWGQIFCSRLWHTASSIWWNGYGWSTSTETQYHCTSPFSNLPVSFLLHDTLPPSSTSQFHHYHPFSFLCSSSQLSAAAVALFVFLISLKPPPPLSSLLSLPPSPLFSDLKHTPRQTVEQSDSPDQTYILNYNPSE